MENYHLQCFSIYTLNFIYLTFTYMFYTIYFAQLIPNILSDFSDKVHCSLWQMQGYCVVVLQFDPHREPMARIFYASEGPSDTYLLTTSDFMPKIY